jgi:hypothetical protein
VLQLQVVIDPDLPPVTEGAVSFETGALETGPLVYGPGRVGPLVAFFEDLVSGLPMPLVFAMHGVSGPHSVVAATLFLRRDLAIHPLTPSLVYAVDLVYRLGDPMLAHVEPDLSRFLRGMKSYFPGGLSKREQGGRLSTAVQWVSSYLTQGSLPNLGPQPESVGILDVGTNGFVLACGKPSVEGWETLYRNGYLKGAIVSQSDGDYRQVLVARKTFGVGFDLERATTILNELETLSGSLPGWRLQGNYLYSPPDGSTILLTYLTEVLLRV